MSETEICGSTVLNDKYISIIYGETAYTVSFQDLIPHSLGHLWVTVERKTLFPGSPDAEYATSPTPVPGNNNVGLASPRLELSGSWMRAAMAACDELATHGSVRCDSKEIDRYRIRVSMKGSDEEQVDFLAPIGSNQRSYSVVLKTDILFPGERPVR